MIRKAGKVWLRLSSATPSLVSPANHYQKQKASIFGKMSFFKDILYLFVNYSKEWNGYPLSQKLFRTYQRDYCTFLQTPKESLEAVSCIYIQNNNAVQFPDTLFLFSISLMNSTIYRISEFSASYSSHSVFLSLFMCNEKFFLYLF